MPTFGAAAAVVQAADVNKGHFNQNYPSTLYLLVIDFTHLEGRDSEIMVKELAAVDSHTNRASSYVFKETIWLEGITIV